MNAYLIRTSSRSAYIPTAYHHVEYMGTSNGEDVIEILDTSNPIKVGDTLIGAWDMAGVAVEPVNSTEYAAFRPFGNAPVEVPAGTIGAATPDLSATHADGWAQRQIGENGELYPPELEPFRVQIRHHYYDTPNTPASTGWGFRSEIVGMAAARDPSVRSMGAYDDPEYETVLWPAIGAYQLGPSAWQVDGEGNPLEVWYLDSWDGMRLSEKRDWYVVMLWASIWEGVATLLVDSEGVEYLFWDRIQGQDPPVGEAWVDTGATITSQAGTIYNISVNTDSLGLVVGQALRLGDTAETTFNGVWSGNASNIQIDPFVQVSVGSKIWKWA